MKYILHLDHSLFYKLPFLEFCQSVHLLGCLTYCGHYKREAIEGIFKTVREKHPSLFVHRNNERKTFWALALALYIWKMIKYIFHLDHSLFYKQTHFGLWSDSASIGMLNLLGMLSKESHIDYLKSRSNKHPRLFVWSISDGNIKSFQHWHWHAWTNGKWKKTLSISITHCFTN